MNRPNAMFSEQCIGLYRFHGKSALNRVKIAVKHIGETI
jgi:hypothetical protein